MTTATCSVILHIADNHRYQPGSGTSISTLFEQLRADNYQGYVVYEGAYPGRSSCPRTVIRWLWLRTC
ncbi:hypothetical protein DMH88_15545 [Escherichia coli]|nr:hypothetical protein [Escherichia coli]